MQNTGHKWRDGEVQRMVQIRAKLYARGFEELEARDAKRAKQQNWYTICTDPNWHGIQFQSEPVLCAVKHSESPLATSKIRVVLQELSPRRLHPSLAHSITHCSGLLATVKLSTIGSGYHIDAELIFIEWEPTPTPRPGIMIGATPLTGKVYEDFAAWLDELDSCLVRAERAPDIVEPRQFGAELKEGPGNRSDLLWITKSGQVRAAAVISIVAFEEKHKTGEPTLRLSPEAVSRPGADCWFLMECESYQGAAFNVITNGEVFYPVARVTSANWSNISSQKPTKKITVRRHCGKASVDENHFSEADKELFQQAIALWLANSRA